MMNVKWSRNILTETREGSGLNIKVLLVSKFKKYMNLIMRINSKRNPLVLEDGPFSDNHFKKLSES